MVENTQRWNLKVCHVTGLENCVSDALSRYPWSSKEDYEICSFEEDGEFAVAAMDFVTTEDILEAANNDDDIQAVKALLKEGNFDNKAWSELQQWTRYKGVLRVVEDQLLYKDRVVVPERRRQKLLHGAHQGTGNMLLRASNCCWWSGLYRDVQSCRDQ